MAVCHFMLNLRGLYFADDSGATSETPSAIASAIGEAFVSLSIDPLLV